jgi:GNAT superfamily N-acetyltransferase
VADIDIRPTRYGAPAAQTLVRAALAELSERYGGEGDETPVDAAQFDPPEGAFLVAWQDGEPVGCGGWRILAHYTDDGMGESVGEDVAEVKRMYTAPDARGRGVGRAVLKALEASARDAGMRRLILETGHLQPEAIALYEKCGYQLIKNYGFYRDHEGVSSFGRDL